MAIANKRTKNGHSRPLSPGDEGRELKVGELATLFLYQKVVKGILSLSDVAAASTFTTQAEDTIEMLRMATSDLGRVVDPPVPATAIYLSEDQVPFKTRAAAEEHREEMGASFPVIIVPSDDDEVVNAAWKHYFQEPACSIHCDACRAGEGPDSGLEFYT